MAAGQRLPFYAQHFDMVELNSSFYAISARLMCERWVEETPDGFLIDVKCHRLLSRHATNLDALPTDLRGQVEVTDRENVVLTPDLEEEVAGGFLEALGPLERAGKLGALLLQMSAGVEVGMTSSQGLGRCAGLRLLTRSPGQETVVGKALLESVFLCSPWILPNGWVSVTSLPLPHT